MRTMNNFNLINFIKTVLLLLSSDLIVISLEINEKSKNSVELRNLQNTSITSNTTIDQLNQLFGFGSTNTSTSSGTTTTNSISPNVTTGINTGTTSSGTSGTSGSSPTTSGQTTGSGSLLTNSTNSTPLVPTQNLSQFNYTADGIPVHYLNYSSNTTTPPVLDLQAFIILQNELNQTLFPIIIPSLFQVQNLNNITQQATTTGCWTNSKSQCTKYAGISNGNNYSCCYMSSIFVNGCITSSSFWGSNNINSTLDNFYTLASFNISTRCYTQSLRISIILVSIVTFSFFIN